MKSLFSLALLIISINIYAFETIIKCQAQAHDTNSNLAIDFPFGDQKKVVNIEVKYSDEDISIKINEKPVKFKMCQYDTNKIEAKCSLLTGIDGISINSYEEHYYIGNLSIKSATNVVRFTDGTIAGAPGQLTHEPPYSLTPMRLRCTSTKNN